MDQHQQILIEYGQYRGELLANKQIGRWQLQWESTHFQPNIKIQIKCNMHRCSHRTVAQMPVVPESWTPANLQTPDFPFELGKSISWRNKINGSYNNVTEIWSARRVYL